MGLTTFRPFALVHGDTALEVDKSKFWKLLWVVEWTDYGGLVDYISFWDVRGVVKGIFKIM